MIRMTIRGAAVAFAFLSAYPIGVATASEHSDICRTVLRLSRPVPFADIVLLDHATRQRPTPIVRGRGGRVVQLVLPSGSRLRPGDGLWLDDGQVILVRAADEDVREIRVEPLAGLSPILAALRRLGVRVEVQRDHLTIKPDRNAEAVARSHGAVITIARAPFQPSER